MKISLTEQDIYKINRKLSDIRTKLQLLESEFIYIPLGTYSKVLDNIVRYTALTTKMINSLTEQEIYKINRKLSDIRTKLQILESEFTYIPLGTYSKVLNNIVRYTALTTELRNMVSSCMTELDRHIPSKHLFSNPNPENHE